MDQRRNDVTQWVAHLPDLPDGHQGKRLRTPVQQRREDREMFKAKEAIKTGQEKSQGQSLDPHMLEAMKICRSEFWESTSFGWMFSREPPAWVDTDPADWSGVKLILQDLKYKDVQRRLSRAKAELKIIQADVTDSDSESTDSCDYPTVRIVSSKSTQKNLKSCVKTRVDLRTNIIKMVIVGSIDIELYSLDEDEIDWKSIPVSLERFEVNGRKIRDISLEEMRVRKVCELGLDLCTDNDKGDSMVTALSRFQLCELYNKKLQSQIAECTLEKPTKTLTSKFPRRQDLSELYGQTSDSLLSEKTGTPITRSKSTKQLVIGRKPSRDTKFNRISTMNTELDSGRNERRRASASDFDTVKHIADNVNMANKRGNTYCEESLTRKSALSDVIDFSGLTTDYLLEQAISECSQETDVKEIAQVQASALSDKQLQKKSHKEGNVKVSLSDSLQSLDELLDEALESRAEFERHRVHTFSATDSNSKPNGSSPNQRAQNRTSLGGIQPKPSESFPEGSPQRVSSETDYDSLFELNRFDKRDNNTGWKPAINVSDSRENSTNNVSSDRPLTEETRHYKNYGEGCEPQRGGMKQRKIRDENSVFGLYNLDSSRQPRKGHTKDLPPAKSRANSSISPVLNVDNGNETPPSGSELCDFNAENASTSNRASHERSSSGIYSCDNIQTHSIDLPSRPGRRKFLNFINRNVSSFWKKFCSFNCCSNSIS